MFLGTIEALLKQIAEDVRAIRLKEGIAIPPTPLPPPILTPIENLGSVSPPEPEHFGPGPGYTPPKFRFDASEVGKNVPLYAWDGVRYVFEIDIPPGYSRLFIGVQANQGHGLGRPDPTRKKHECVGGIYGKQGRVDNSFDPMPINSGRWVAGNLPPGRYTFEFTPRDWTGGVVFLCNFS